MNIEEMHSWFDVLQDKGDSPYFTVDEKTQFLNRAMTKYVNSILNSVYLTSGKAPENNVIPYSSMESIQAGEDALLPIITRLESDSSHIMSTYGSEHPRVNKYGQVSIAMLNTYIQQMKKQDHASTSRPNFSTWDQVKVLHLLSMRWRSAAGVDMRYIRFSDVYKVQKNSFTSPTVEDPIYFIQKSDRYEILPRQTADGSSFYSLWDEIPAQSDPYVPAVVYSYPNQPSANATKCKLFINVVRTPCPLRYDPLNSNNNVSCELPDFTHDDIMAIALDDAGVASRDQALMTLNQASKANLTPPQ